MKKVLQVFRRDLRRLLHNPIALIVALGVAAVPCLYAWINIVANWDPYENTSDIPVAIVNQDTPVEVGSMGSICTGDMLVEALAENDKIGWTFVNEGQAMDGVHAGTYYAAIVIPSDFTQSLTNVLNGTVQKAHLKYFVNEKANAVAPKVTDTGATTIENQVDERFVATVGKVVTQKLGDVSDALEAKGETAENGVEAALSEVRTTISTVDDKLDGLSQSLQNAKDALGNASDKLKGHSGAGTGVANSLGSALNNLGQTRTNASDLMSRIRSALGNGANTIQSLSSTATYDVSAIAGDVSAASSQLDSAIRALETDLTDDKALTSQIEVTQDLVSSIDPKTSRGIELQTSLSKDLTIEHEYMVNLTDDQSAKLDELRAIAQRLDGAAQEVSSLSSDVNERVQTTTNTLQNTQNGTVSTTLDQINASLDTFVQIAKELQTAARLIDPIIDQTAQVTADLASTVQKTDDALASTKGSLASIDESIQKLQDELGAIRASSAWDLLRNTAKSNAQEVYDFLSAPVNVKQKSLYPVANYGSGVAPFFTSLALWVGGIALVAIFKLEVDEEEVGRLRPWQAYFGRWLLLVMLGALTAIICCTGDLLLGVQCVEVWALYLAAIVAAFAFVNIIFALSVAFKHLGKALAFTLIILQVPGSSGMYPIEMMPSFFRSIGPWLPFTYSNNALREAIAGFYGTNYLYNLLILLAFVIPALLIGVSARSHLVNVNALFDRRLRETDHLMVSEAIPIRANRYRLATVVKAMRDPDEYREAVEERSAAFTRRYPMLVARGVLALLVLPLALFALALVLDTKLPLIAALAVALILIYVYLILVEYFMDRIASKRMLSDLDRHEQEAILDETLRDELMPYAHMDAIIEKRQKRHERRIQNDKTVVLPRVVAGAQGLVGDLEAQTADDVTSTDEDASTPPCSSDAKGGDVS